MNWEKLYREYQQPIKIGMKIPNMSLSAFSLYNNRKSILEIDVVWLTVAF